MTKPEQKPLSPPSTMIEDKTENLTIQIWEEVILNLLKKQNIWVDDLEEQFRPKYARKIIKNLINQKKVEMFYRPKAERFLLKIAR